MYQTIHQIVGIRQRAGTAVIEDMRRTAHILLPARNNNVRFAALNSLRRQVQRF
ncbi:Uncharacterised protein [Salmonella enterica subsp. enterica]|uniref:Uncharacterized protein n=1 Tax=Salmonella enterica subsp. enterica serovar Bovismorbificans TaxID=58097 RepID=A0A655BU30_SALET|nr:Uncharacterised protein [Salmonella enterica subsp. enterica serovar Bovismorbificans]VFS83611.1 Uncharacterised protein [Salmonella enterica subsp. enterica]